MAEVRLSQIRREIAEAVAQGKVVYAPGRARWTLEGQAVTGWQGRTLREMFSEGLVLATAPGAVDSSTQVRARLSAAAARALRVEPEATHTD